MAGIRSFAKGSSCALSGLVPMRPVSQGSASRLHPGLNSHAALRLSEFCRRAGCRGTACRALSGGQYTEAGTACCADTQSKRADAEIRPYTHVVGYLVGFTVLEKSQFGQVSSYPRTYILGPSLPLTGGYGAIAPGRGLRTIGSGVPRRLMASEASRNCSSSMIWLSNSVSPSLPSLLPLASVQWAGARKPSGN